MSITPLTPSLFAWGRVTWVKSQWKLCAYPGHFSVEINKHIATSLRLAEALGFNGTPSFVVGDQLIPGFVEKAQLAEVVAAARAAE